jgi:hypothetical protein
VRSVTALSRFEKVWLWIVDDKKLRWYRCSVCNCVVSCLVIPFGDVCAFKSQCNSLLEL